MCVCARACMCMCMYAVCKCVRMHVYVYVCAVCAVVHVNTWAHVLEPQLTVSPSHPTIVVGDSIQLIH